LGYAAPTQACIGYAKEAVICETKLFVQKELDLLSVRNALPDDFPGSHHARTTTIPRGFSDQLSCGIVKGAGSSCVVERQPGALHEDHDFLRLIPSEVERMFTTVTELSSDNPHQSSPESPLLPRGYGVLFALVTVLSFSGAYRIISIMCLSGNS
jgi:hypothetical protein